MGIKLIDLSARSDYKSKLDDSEEKTSFMVGPLTARQMFAMFGKADVENNKQDSAKMSLLAVELVKYGLKDVKGPLGKGFKLKKGNKLGFKCDVVDQSYIDTLPISLIAEISEWVSECSHLGESPKET
tara:strand:+ start:707 stop:1090 length:384 start_codon:yes stop_codon:yes gene_type:complete